MTVSAVIEEGLIDFEQRWGLRPNAMVMHPRTFHLLISETTPPAEQLLEFDEIKILRSPDMPEGKIRFAL
jgi:hypothetical protein